MYNTRAQRSISQKHNARPSSNAITCGYDKARKRVNTARITRERNAVLVKNAPSDHGSYYSCLAYDSLLIIPSFLHRGYVWFNNKCWGVKKNAPTFLIFKQKESIKFKNPI